MDSNPQQADVTEAISPIRLVVFAVLSVGFFVWVGFGQVEARVWVEGQLTLLDRNILEMWQYLGNNLPELPGAGLVSMVYWMSLSFIVVGTILGLWLMLCTPESDPRDESWEAIHAAHLNDANE